MRRVFTLLSFVIITLLVSFSSADADSDWELWTKFSLEKSFGNRVSGQAAGALRFHDDFTDHYYRFLEFGFNNRRQRLYEWGLFMRFGSIESGSDWNFEGRPYGFITPIIKLSTISISDRSRFEYVNVADRDDVWRYRNRLMVTFPLSIIRSLSRTSIYYEWFWELNDTRLVQRRLGFEFSGAVARSLDLAVSFIIRSQKGGGDWNDDYILSGALNLRL